jgi:hypothetical protein
VLNLAVEGAGLDTVWAGAPGEPISTAIRVRVTDDEGRPLPGASLEWAALGQGAQVLNGTAQTSSTGLATAGWLLGTNAAEEQRLQLTVRTSRRESQIVIRARAVPHIVSQLRVALDTPAVLRLGDTLPVAANAIDPYGNVFPAPDLAISLADSALGSIVEASVIGGPRRGRSVVHVASHGVEAAFPLHVTQYVAAIVPVADTLRFSALGAQRPIAYVVRDDRGRVVADTTAAISVEDPSVVQLGGEYAQAVTSGATRLRITLGEATATIAVGVQQRVGSLRLVRDTIRLDALLDTTTVNPVAHDSLGAAIADPALVYDVSDVQVVKFAAGRTLQALTSGAALVTVRDPATGISTSAPVVVRQVVARIDLPSTHILFDALGDTLTLGAIARDRLGSVVPGAALDYAISDSSVVALQAGSQLRAVGPGHALVEVLDPETGIVGPADVLVDQVATALNVTVTYGQPVVTLSAGAAFPLACEAFDRNGFPIARDVALVGSVRGTVTGAGCGDARVQRSGYDTLLFAMGGAQARVPVIVSTGPDSVGVVEAAQPLTTVERDLFVGEALGNPSILALRPLVHDILEAYGNPTSSLDRARALRDWVARTAIHPHPPLHPDNSTSNLGVLPPGKTWADVNALTYRQSAPDSIFNATRTYWYSVGYDGYAMLDRLLGTLDPSTGIRADDGMMVHLGGARYQIRDLESYQYTFCTFQDIVLNSLLAAAGLHGMLISTVGHDPNAVFIPELGRWVYEDPTFNEEYLLDGEGEPLSPTDLLAISSAGQGSRLRATKLQGPSFDPQVYVEDLSYVAQYPEGMVIMGSQLYNRVVGAGAWANRLVQIDVPRLADEPPFNNVSVYDRVTADVAFPTLGVVVQQLEVQDSVHLIHLSSTFPNHARFERRVNNGDWEAVASLDILPVGGCRVEYRSVDDLESVSTTALVDVWVPRAQDFVESGLETSLRAEASYCS